MHFSVRILHNACNETFDLLSVMRSQSKKCLTFIFTTQGGLLVLFSIASQVHRNGVRRTAQHGTDAQFECYVQNRHWEKLFVVAEISAFSQMFLLFVRGWCRTEYWWAILRSQSGVFRSKFGNKDTTRETILSQRNLRMMEWRGFEDTNFLISSALIQVAFKTR